MATIGDKKVSLSLQDGSSINLNKPKVLPASITKIADITEPGWYIGGTVAGIVPQSLEDESNPVASTSDSDNGIDVQANGSDSIFKLYDDSEINYVITDAPYRLDDLLTSTIFILYVYPIISKSSGSNAVDGNDPDISGFGYFLMTRYGKLHIGTRTNSTEVIAWDEIVTGHDMDSFIEYFQQSYIIDNLISTDTNKALSAKQGKTLKELIDRLSIKQINSDVTDLASITESGTYIGVTNFDKFDELYSSQLVNWPDTLITTWMSKTGVPYVLRVINNTLSTDSNLYYELLCLGNKVFGIFSSSLNRILWDRDIPLIFDSLNENATNAALSAKQGRVLKEMVDKKLDEPIASTTDLTAGSSELATGHLYIVYE